MMKTQILKAKYLSNWTIKPEIKIDPNPQDIFIYLRYNDIENKKWDKINLNNLVWVIKKDYSWEYKEFLLDKYK